MLAPGRLATGRLPGLARTGGVFTTGAQGADMSALREALRDLPDAVFADLLESESAYLLVIDVPGVDPESVQLRTETGRLVIEARRGKDVPPGFEYVGEDRSLFLDAELPLPPDATGNGAEASLSDGVLAVTLPKRAAAPETTIPVETA